MYIFLYYNPPPKKKSLNVKFILQHFIMYAFINLD